MREDSSEPRPRSPRPQDTHHVVAKPDVELFTIFSRTGPPLRGIGPFLSAVRLRPVGVRKNPAYDRKILIRGVRGRECASKRVPGRPIERPYVVLDPPVERIVATRESDKGSRPGRLQRAFVESVLLRTPRTPRCRCLSMRPGLDRGPFLVSCGSFSSKSPISRFAILASKGELLYGSRTRIDKSSATNHLFS